MMGQTLTTKVLITNPQGFHMRPAAAFVKVAKQFQCSVVVGKDDQRVDGKSVINLLSLGAPCGSELTLEVNGVDAGEAMAALLEVVNTTFEEPETPPTTPVC
jgi:phosphotransferase system HPr (HPr) family protein